jgi:hypothetical protein
MIHGDCASVGCYAMTDEQITEIYSLAREAFFGGQRSFQIQAYPFRMIPLNMARHRNSPHLAFWKVLKEGYDHFEVTRKEPKVAVCDKHYVFDAQSSGNSAQLMGAPPQGGPADHGRRSHQAAARRDRDRPAHQPMETHRFGHKRGDGGMNPRFPVGTESPWRAGCCHSYRLRHDTGACPSAGRLLSAKH